MKLQKKNHLGLYYVQLLTAEKSQLPSFTGMESPGKTTVIYPPYKSEASPTLYRLEVKLN